MSVGTVSGVVCVCACSRMQNQSGSGAWAAELRGALRLGADADRVQTEQLLVLATQVYGDDPQAQVSRIFSWGIFGLISNLPNK
jgi:hypothetical protein